MKNTLRNSPDVSNGKFHGIGKFAVAYAGLLDLKLVRFPDAPMQVLDFLVWFLIEH